MLTQAHVLRGRTIEQKQAKHQQMSLVLVFVLLLELALVMMLLLFSLFCYKSSSSWRWIQTQIRICNSTWMDHFAGGTLRGAKVKWPWDDGNHKAEQADKLNPTSLWKVVGILWRACAIREMERERESVYCSKIQPSWSTKTRVSCAIGQKMLTSTLLLSYSVPLKSFLSASSRLCKRQKAVRNLGS